jgi:Na+/H+-dicarboxylate symporter
LSEPRSSKSFLQTLYFRVLVGIVAGVDRFLSEMRSVTNIIGNGVATIVISRWEGQFDLERARAVLNGTQTAVEDDITLREHAGVM